LLWLYVSAGGAAQIVTAFAIGKFVGTVIGGIVLDRMGTRVALIGGPLAASVASFATIIRPLAERDPGAGASYGCG
jgi:predicted MFS family arabinose efflux permease